MLTSGTTQTVQLVNIQGNPMTEKQKNELHGHLEQLQLLPEHFLVQNTRKISRGGRYIFALAS